MALFINVFVFKGVKTRCYDITQGYASFVSHKVFQKSPQSGRLILQHRISTQGQIVATISNEATPLRNLRPLIFKVRIADGAYCSRGFQPAVTAENHRVP